MIPVMISVQSTAWRDDVPDTETIRLLVPGNMELSQHTACLHYEETLDESEAPQQVTVTVTDESVTMERQGVYASNLFFKKDLRFQSVYYTPSGQLNISEFCTHLKTEFDADGGQVTIKYQLDINDQFASMHEMQLLFYRQEENTVK